LEARHIHIGFQPLRYSGGGEVRKGAAMKTITVEEFSTLNDICDDYPEGRIREIAGDKADWSALDILALEDIPAKDRLEAVLREELIDIPILQKFTHHCDEMLLRPRSSDISVAEDARHASFRAALTVANTAGDSALEGTAPSDPLLGIYIDAHRSAYLAEREEQVRMLTELLKEKRP
jgi:hypothetical protein